MQREDVEREIEKLKLKANELRNKTSMTEDFEKKDDLEKQIAAIQNQIRTLEKLKS